jgi:putative acetyltransferase
MAALATTLFEPIHSQQVIALFKRVFSDSEGPAEGQVISDFVTELIATDAADLYGFVAIESDQVIAAIFFSRMRFAEAVEAFILSPVAVDTDHQGEGVGQQLIRFGIDYLKQQGVELVLTYGDPDFYAKVGFEPISEQLIPAPLELSQPMGWLGQSLTVQGLRALKGPSHCVEALNKPALW